MGRDASAQVEVIVVNWRRPANLPILLGALRKQTTPVAIAVIDCSTGTEYAAPPECRELATQVLRVKDAGGAWSRYAWQTLGKHPYKLFLDDDLLPGPRAVESLLDAMRAQPRCGAMGHLSRTIGPDLTYDMSKPATAPTEPAEVDVIIRAYMVRPEALQPALAMTAKLPRRNDDLLMCMGMRMAGWKVMAYRPFDKAMRVDAGGLPEPHALHKQPNHAETRTRDLRAGYELGWRPLCMRDSPAAQA